MILTSYRESTLSTTKTTSSSTCCLGSMRPSTPRRDSKTGEPSRSSRRRVKPFLPNHCRSWGIRACLPSSLWKPCRQGATNSGQAASWAKTLNCSRSPNLAPKSIESTPTPATSRDTPRENPKRNPPLTPDRVPVQTDNCHWTQAGYGEPFGIHRRTVFHPEADDNLRLWGWTPGEERHLSPFIPTPCRSTRIGPSKLVFQRDSGSPDKASLDPHFVRPVDGPLAFDNSKVIWRRVVLAPASDSKAGKHRQPIKDPGEDIYGTRFHQAL